jgi:CubicO group peptidase (beta-lactamase class C family)
MRNITQRRTRAGSFRSLVALAALLVSGIAAAGAGDAASEGRVADALRLLDLWIAEQISYHDVPGMAIGVVRGDRTVWAKGYGRADLATGAPVATSTPFRLGSVSKVFTAVAVMLLRDQGKLSLDDPVTRHLPWFRINSPYTGAPPITIRHLLTHTSGLPREAAWPYWTTHQFPTREEFHRALATQSVSSPPGASYRYSNVGFTLLGEIVEAASGRGYAEYLGAHVFGPLGMTSSTAAPDAAQVAALARGYQRRRAGEARRVMSYYDTGMFAPMGGVISTVDDLAKFVALLLSADAGGSAQAGAGRVVAAPTLAEMQRLQFVYPSFTGGRGLGFAVTRRDDATYVGNPGWIGGHQAQFLCDPARRLGVVVMTNADDAGPGSFARQALDVVGEALDASPPAAAAKQADPAWAAYFGTYTDPWGWEIEVLTLGGDLALYEHDYPPDEDPDASLNRLTPVAGEAHSFTMGDGERVRFEMSEDGTVRRMQRRYDFFTPVR